MILVNKESMLPVQALLVRIIRDSSFDNELEKALTTNVQVLPITKLLMASGKYPDIVAGAQ
jgi:putative aldouronate transport system permease protein